jgi:hypothetical protein
MDAWAHMDFWTQRMTTIFTTLPSDGEWIALGGAVLLVLSWLYLLSAVRSVKRRTKQIEREVRAAIETFSGTAMEQQGELIRRIGWAVTYLEHIDQKLDHPGAGNMRVASITAENLVVRPENEGSWRGGGNGR